MKPQPKSFFQIVDYIELEPLSGFFFIAIYAVVEVVSIYVLIPRQSEQNLFNKETDSNKNMF